MKSVIEETSGNAGVRYRIVVTPEAEADLDSIYDFIKTRTGSPDLAFGYVSRIRSTIEKLTDFPERGTRRDDIAEGVRLIGFERRAAILIQVRSNEARVLRILYGGRSLPKG